jgi:hypothetical protein
LPCSRLPIQFRLNLRQPELPLRMPERISDQFKCSNTALRSERRSLATVTAGRAFSSALSGDNDRE